jgi:carbamoyltransferase
MNILGINDGHLSTACLLVGGKVVACVSEEKFTKVKNQLGFPVQSIKYCLDGAGLKISDIDLAVFGGEMAPPAPVSSSPQSNQGLKTLYSVGRLVIDSIFSSKLAIYFPEIRKVKEKIYNLSYKFLKGSIQRARRDEFKKHFSDSPKEIVFLEHHYCHAYAALFASGFAQSGGDVLVLTCDGEGDRYSATVGVFKNGKYERISQTSMNDSLGLLYFFATVHMGMKPMEHEYKVMGLAPYASPYDVDKAHKKIVGLITLDAENLSFKAKFDAHLFGKFFKDNLYGVRFDHFSGAVQKVTEDLLTSWVSECVKRTGIDRVALGGGVFMNVKANQKILELKEVKELFIMPSCGDESNAVGACFWGSFEKFSTVPQVLKSLALGPKYTNQQIESFLCREAENGKIEFNLLENPVVRAAEIVSRGEVIAILDGPVEFGARALGNRSIMADASLPGVVEKINKMIKIRDFWMPFAPVILEERQSDYLINPKRMPAPYMIITFDSTPKAQEDLRGAMHPYDKTLRPQVINIETNAYYYGILKEYERFTGRGGCLNTSFNLHGDPIVNSPEDAIKTFLNSGLNYLFIENYLVTKK